MKNKFLVSALLLVGSSFFQSCDKGDDPVTNADTEAVSAKLRSGNWVISTFKKDGVDQLAQVQDYGYQFGEGNELRAVKLTETITGTWSVTADDDRPTELDLNIFFSNAGALRMLNDDWEIIRHTDTRIELADDYGERDEDLLILEKSIVSPLPD